MMCVVFCGACRCGRGVRLVVVVVCVCVWCRVCVFFVCCGTLKKRGKTSVWIQKRLSVHIQNVSVCTSTTRTCVSTCSRGAGTHGDVFEWTHGVQEVIASSAYEEKKPTYGYHVLQRGSPKETIGSYPFKV